MPVDQNKLKQGIAERIRASRIDNGQSISALARAAGIDRSYLHKLEGGVASVPGLAVLMNLAEALDVDDAWLCGFGRETFDPAGVALHEIERRVERHVEPETSMDTTVRLAIWKAINELAKAAMEYTETQGEQVDHTDPIAT